MNNWEIVFTCTYPHEAHIIMGKLESEGISVQIKDELTAQVNNFYSNAIGGVKVLVAENDYNRAIEILIETGNITAPEPSDNIIFNFVNNIFTKQSSISEFLSFKVIIFIFILLFISISLIVVVF